MTGPSYTYPYVGKAHLGIQRDDFTVAGNDQRVDFREAAIAVDKRAAHGSHEFFGTANGFAFETQFRRELACLVAQQAGVWVEAVLEDFLRCVRGDLFDIHAAFARNHQYRTGGSAIDDDAEVQLASNVATFFDQYLADGLTFGASLDCDQFATQQSSGDFGCFGRAFDQLYAVLLGITLDGALAASTGMEMTKKVLICR